MQLENAEGAASAAKMMKGVMEVKMQDAHQKMDNAKAEVGDSSLTEACFNVDSPQATMPRCVSSTYRGDAPRLSGVCTLTMSTALAVLVMRSLGVFVNRLVLGDSIDEPGAEDN